MIGPEDAVSRRRAAPVARSQIMMDRSLMPPEASDRPSGEIAMWSTVNVWPAKAGPFPLLDHVPKDDLVGRD